MMIRKMYVLFFALLGIISVQGQLHQLNRNDAMKASQLYLEHGTTIPNVNVADSTGPKAVEVFSTTPTATTAKSNLGELKRNSGSSSFATSALAPTIGNAIANKAEGSKNGPLLHRSRRSYDTPLPGNLDLSKFYTPAGLQVDDGGEMMTKNELEREQEKFLRLLAILSSVKSGGGHQGGSDEEDFTDDGGRPSTSSGVANAGLEPVISLMSSKPKHGGKPGQSRESDAEWLDDPISIHRHRIARRASYPAEARSNMFRIMSRRMSQKRMPADLFENEAANEREQLYSLNELLSQAQRNDPRFPVVRHRFLL